MPTGVGTALLISSAIGAGTSIAEGAIQSHQTGKAVKAQEDAAAKAQANLKPFQDVGTQAFQTLGGLMGLGGGQAQATPSLPKTGLTGPAAPPGFQAGAISDPSKNGGYAGQVPGTNTLGARGDTMNNTSSGYAPKTSPIPTVRMRAPDGTEKDVPGDQVGFYTQKGATVIHG
jgi:hypothetical protein